MRRLTTLVEALLLGSFAVNVIATLDAGETQPDQTLVCHRVTRENLDVTVTVRGDVESQQNTVIRCELEDFPGDGFYGTPILWIVDSGSSIKQGDMLVEFDSARIRGALDARVIAYQNALVAKTKAETEYKRRIIRNEVAKTSAEFQVKLAELELESFRDPESGIHQLEIENLERLVDATKNEVALARANLEVRRSNLELAKNQKSIGQLLYQLVWGAKGMLDQCRLELLQAETQMSASMSHLTKQQAELQKKRMYDYRMRLFQLERKLATAKDDLERARVDNVSVLAQLEATRDVATASVQNEMERLKRLETKLMRCKIHARRMTAWSCINSSQEGDPVVEGTFVCERQPVLALPDLAKMQVRTAVPESVLGLMRPGLPASIQVIAFPERTYSGTVKAVAVLPDQRHRLDSGEKVFETILTYDKDVTDLWPGMTAVAQIQVATLQDVLTVPVQVILRGDDDTWCYVQVNAKIERRSVKTGMTNDVCIEIRDGLAEGDEVILDPTSVPRSHR